MDASEGDGPGCSFMKRTLPYASMSIVGLMLMSGLVLAHHGDSGRYEEKLTTVTGSVVEVQIINPHSILVLEVPDESGKVVRWRGELGSALVLRRWGWTRESIKIGDTLTMVGRRLKNGQPYMTLSENARVIDVNGKELYRGNDPGQPPGYPRPPQE